MLKKTALGVAAAAAIGFAALTPTSASAHGVHAGIYVPGVHFSVGTPYYGHRHFHRHHRLHRRHVHGCRVKVVKRWKNGHLVKRTVRTCR